MVKVVEIARNRGKVVNLAKFTTFAQSFGPGRAKFTLLMSNFTTELVDFGPNGWLFQSQLTIKPGERILPVDCHGASGDPAGERRVTVATVPGQGTVWVPTVPWSMHRVPVPLSMLVATVIHAGRHRRWMSTVDHKMS